MRQLLRRGNAAAIALGVIALAIAAAGGAYAASSGGVTITVCIHHSGGGLYKAKNCQKGDKKLTWNKQGRAGTNGTNGVNGTNAALAGYSATKAAAVDISGATNTTPATVLTLSLPAGSFMVNAKAESHESTTSASTAFAECDLTDGSAADTAQTFGQMGTLLEGIWEGMLPMSIAVTSASPSTVKMTCFGFPTGSSATSVIENSVITAVQTTANH